MSCFEEQSKEETVLEFKPRTLDTTASSLSLPIKFVKQITSILKIATGCLSYLKGCLQACLQIKSSIAAPILRASGVLCLAKLTWTAPPETIWDSPGLSKCKHSSDRGRQRWAGGQGSLRGPQHTILAQASPAPRKDQAQTGPSHL